MKLSVVTPSYNQGKYVRRCLESVTNQEGLEIEHIVLDAMSTDETVQVLSEFEAKDDGVVRIIRRRHDDGQTAAINEGFQLATGDIVCWLNTDEYFLPGALALVRRFFLSNAQVDLLYGNCLFLDDQGLVLRDKESLPFRRGMLLYFGSYLPSCATFFRRRVIDEGQVLDPRYKVCMDYEYWVRLVDAGYTCRYLPATLAAFTWHQNNISLVYRKKGDEEFREVQRKHSAILRRHPALERFLPLARLYWRAYRVTLRAVRSLTKTPQKRVRALALFSEDSPDWNSG